MKETIHEERNHYPREFKHSVIKEFLVGELGHNALLRKHNIKINGGITRWMRQLGYLDNEGKDGYSPPLKSLALPSKKANKTTSSATEAQEQRIKELERLLEDEQIRSEAYSRMIDIAERDFNIPIRKKPVTK